jgi:hypothetical protein
MDGLLNGTVDRTNYEIGNGGTFLVSFYLSHGEVIKSWLRLNSSEFKEFWTERTRRPTPSSIDEAVDIAVRGGLLPTKEIKYRREGKWPKLISTAVGAYNPAIRKFVEDAAELFGPLEVVKVTA